MKTCISEIPGGFEVHLSPKDAKRVAGLLLRGGFFTLVRKSSIRNSQSKIYLNLTHLGAEKANGDDARRDAVDTPPVPMPGTGLQAIVSATETATADAGQQRPALVQADGTPGPISQ